MSLPNPSDLQGLMNRCFDSVNNALRVTAAAESQYQGAEELSLLAGTRTLVIGNDVPRLAMVDAVTTTYAGTFFLPNYWTGADVGFIYTSSATAAGNMRWRTALKKHALFIDNVSEAFLADISATADAPDQGVISAQLEQIDNVNVTPDAFGTLCTLLVSRLGADAADTYTGTAELIGLYCRRN